MPEQVMKRLAEEIKLLEHELTTELPAEIKKAVALGDLSENAEYHMAKQRQVFVNARLGQLKKRMGELAMVNLVNIPNDKVGFGSTVTVFDSSKDEELKYQLVTSEESDVAKGLISTTSPIGRALLGKQVGDMATVITPNGKRELEILKLLTIHDAAEELAGTAADVVSREAAKTGFRPRRTRFLTWTSAFGKGSGWLLQKIVNGLALTRISPNMLTFIGLVINIIAACFFGFARAQNANRMFLYAGLIIIGAGIFDMVDGRVARKTNQVSVFGAFFDSVMDRYSDVAIFFGLLIYYARGNRLFYVGLVAFVMTACVMVSYTRARAEALIGTCKVGFMERPERIVCVILGALCNRWGVMAPALWVLALFSTLTVIHRIRYTYLETERRKLQPTR